MKRINLIFYLLFGIFVQAQEFYICTFEFDPVNQTINQSIQTIDQNFDITFLTDVDSSSGNLLDIALADDGTMYGITEGSVIIEINLNDGSITNLKFLNSSLNFTSLVYDGLTNSLKTLESTTNTLYSYNLDTMMVTSMVEIGVHTPGDLTFYKGNLIFLDQEALEMVTYTGSQVETIACGGGQDFYGLSNYVTSCNENLVYAFSSGGGIYRYDIDTGTFQLVIDLDLQDFSIFGSTTVNEYMASTCPFETLNVIDCELGVSQNTLQKLKIYPVPATNSVYFENRTLPKKMRYELYSAKGELVKQGYVENEILLQSLPSGLYFLTIFNEKKTLQITKKIIKE